MQCPAPYRDEGLGLVIDLPFDARIMIEPLPKHLKMPQLDIYDGSTDPVDYLESFKVRMLLHGTTNKCCVVLFPLPCINWHNTGILAFNQVWFTPSVS